jgi:putative phosphoribosyl transferase
MTKAMFRNREEAGELLVTELARYRNDPTGIIVALPRGGVAVGYQLSLGLHLPLDVVITRKIGAPDNPEYAMGAVSETGAVYWNREALQALAPSQGDLDRAIHAQKDEVARRVALYRQGRSFPHLADRTVVVVDDGIATGATFFASVASVRHFKPRRVIGAIPVGPGSTIREIRAVVDELIVLMVPEPFYAVGNFYDDFAQVEDREVLQYLNMAEEALASSKASPMSPQRPSHS